MSVLDHNYSLDSRYTRNQGQVFLTGTQALVRLMLMQAQMDVKAGLNTAGFVSGYRGSPLGGVDQEMWRAEKLLTATGVSFLPAINEDLAATAVLGTQQTTTDMDATVDGVYSMWYGKGPGVDRAGDALKHGNAYGSSAKGGVLVVAGDDHGCVSSSMAHQSDVAFMAWFMPTINPASITEMLEFGLWGFALSRFSGMWVGYKAVSELVESAQTVTLPALPDFVIPSDFAEPAAGLHYRWPDLPGPQIEERMVAKKQAVLAFARANPIDRRIYSHDARFGIITTGKAHGDLMEALKLLGLTEARCREIGIDIYKVGMVWPLEMQGLCSFMDGKDEILIVEEKRGIIESQLKEYLWSTPTAPQPRIFGKHNADKSPLLSWVGEFSPRRVAEAVVYRLGQSLDLDLVAELNQIQRAQATVAPILDVKRMPYFCSGCPHNRSTKVPDGSKALAGIGCHFMASWMGRNTTSLIQMGGEGVNWVGRAPYVGNGHIFQNLGEGTYFHSGSMAIRQAVAAGTNITYKILFNDAVAMTGGQPVDGDISVPQIAAQVRAEGVEHIAIVTDEPEKYLNIALPKNVNVYNRDELDRLQRDYREIPGTTVLIYDQTCAAEKRRRRKRGTYPDPAKRAFINEAVCEGCGDCSQQSNCLSIVPVETPAGRKRRIDQHSCNKDFSCINGFCPSFVTVEGGTLKKRDSIQSDILTKALASLDTPNLKSVAAGYDLLVGGVGGTGVVTIGAIVTMAAHLEGNGASVLDFMGFAQKGGSVLSYIRLASSPEALNQVRIEAGQADAFIACDMVVATGPQALKVLSTDKTRIALNLEEIPTGDFVLDRDANMHSDERVNRLIEAVGKGNVTAINASELAIKLMGDSVYSNMLMTGYAWQQGLIPISFDALNKAIKLNGVSVDKNVTAFSWGRMMAADPDFVLAQLDPVKATKPQSLDELILWHINFLTKYQNAAYANKYSQLVASVQKTEQAIDASSTKLTEAVAKATFKAMAIKDEYEVARLYTDGRFMKAIRQNFAGDIKLKFHMAPPIFGNKNGPLGRPVKKQFGGWMMGTLKLLAAMKSLRGTAFDPMQFSAERKTQRELLNGHEGIVGEVLDKVTATSLDSACNYVGALLDVRGYGPVFETAYTKYKADLPHLRAAFIGEENV